MLTKFSIFHYFSNAGFTKQDPLPWMQLLPTKVSTTLPYIVRTRPLGHVFATEVLSLCQDQLAG